MNATAPMPGASRPAPEIVPVVMSASTNGISALWMEPATERLTTAFQRMAADSLPEIMPVMS